MSLVKSVGKQKVNVDFNKDFINLFTDKIKGNDVAFINQTLEDLHPADVADLIENLDSNTRNKLIEIKAFAIDPETFVELNESLQSEVLIVLTPESIAKILHRLVPHVRVLINFLDVGDVVAGVRGVVVEPVPGLVPRL